MAPEAGGVKRALPTLAPNVVSEAYILYFVFLFFLDEVRSKEDEDKENEDKENGDKENEDDDEFKDEITFDVDAKYNFLCEGTGYVIRVFFLMFSAPPLCALPLPLMLPLVPIPEPKPLPLCVNVVGVLAIDNVGVDFNDANE